MGWDRKRSGPSSGYFYRSVRTPDKPHPVKVYLGRGEAAHRAAAEIERAQVERIAERAAVRDEEAELADLDRLTRQVHDAVKALTQAWLITAGFYNHHGEWRLRHVDKPTKIA